MTSSKLELVILQHTANKQDTLNEVNLRRRNSYETVHNTDQTFVLLVMLYHHGPLYQSLTKVNYKE